MFGGYVMLVSGRVNVTYMIPKKIGSLVFQSYRYLRFGRKRVGFRDPITSKPFGVWKPRECLDLD